MRPKRDPVPRAKEAWWWLGGIFTLGLVGGGVVVAGIALWENIDIRQLAPGIAQPTASLPVARLGAPSAMAESGFSVVLVESERNAAFFEDASFYSTELGRWQRLAEAAGGAVRMAYDVEGMRSVTSDEVLLLPEMPCVTSEELAVVVRHLEQGGSVVTNWAFGVRDGACAWRGWQPLLDVTGAEAIRELPDRGALYFTVPGGLPTSPGIDPGTRVELRPDPAIALRMGGGRVYWSDWALNPAPDADGAGADVAISTTRSPEGGRVTWFGVRTNQAATSPDSAKLERVLRNGIRWAGGAPHASPAAWPGAAQSALTFALDVEGLEASVNARDAAAMFAQEGIPVSFFVVSQLVQDDTELARALMSAGEVGSQTVDHAPLVGLTRQDQTIRLRRSWSDVERWTGVGPEGLRPPEEAIDATTLRAWRAAGGTYVLTANEARSASPEIHDTEDGPVVLLPRLLKDDYTVIVRDVTLRSRRLADAFLSGTRKMRAIGGFAVIAGHTQIIAPGPRLEAVRTVADTTRSQGDWWLAEAREVAAWWLDRSRVQLQWVPTSGPAESQDTRSALDEDLLVSVESGVEIDGLWIDVAAPTLGEGALPLVDGVSVAYVEESWGVRVDVGSVRAGESRRISFVTVGGEGASTDSDAAGQ